jgi:hypothetical protein
MIEALATRYFLEAAPVVVDSTIKAIKHANDILTYAAGIEDMRERTAYLASAKDFLAVTDKKEARLMVGMGILPAPQVSMFVSRLYAASEQVLLSDQIQGLLGPIGDQVTVASEDDVVDVPMDALRDDEDSGDTLDDVDIGPTRDDGFVAVHPGEPGEDDSPGTYEILDV